MAREPRKGVASAGLFSIAISASLLAGCAAERNEPLVKPSPSATCDTATAQVTWEPKFEDVPAEVGYRVLTVDPDGNATSVDEEIPYESRLSTDRSSEIKGKEWVDFLVDEFTRTGQSQSTDVGDPRVNFDAVSLPSATEGVYVFGYRTSQIAVPFTVECDGREAATGTLNTSEGTDLITAYAECGEPPFAGAADDEYVLGMLDHCPSV